jgi:hypothetical protein
VKIYRLTFFNLSQKSSALTILITTRFALAHQLPVILAVRSYFYPNEILGNDRSSSGAALVAGGAGEMLYEYRKPKNLVPAASVRRNPICRSFFSGSAVGAMSEVVVRIASAIEVTLRHHCAAFLAKMFVSHRRSPSARA